MASNRQATLPILLNGNLIDKHSIGLGMYEMGYMFGIGLNGISVWDCVIQDMGVGLGLGM